MERFCYGVFCAVAIACLLPELPPLKFLLLSGLFLLISGYFKAYLLMGFSLFLFSLSGQVWWHQQRVQATLELDQQPLVGEILSIPTRYEDSYFFLLAVKTAQDFNSPIIAVRWFDTLEKPAAGQIWQFQLKLKPVRGVANPGSGSREMAALVHGVVAQGTVKAYKPLRPSRSLRQQAFDKLTASAGQLPSFAILLALTVGERPFTPELWQALQSSGLSHLISISGMHIALVFGWILLLKPIIQWLPLNQLSRERLLWGLALMGALAYCTLAGFAIPTWRALLAIIIMTILRLLLRRTSGWRFSLVFTAVLLVCWPTLMLSMSFWLSVCAVALIFYMQWRFPQPNHWRGTIQQFVYFQWLFTVMLLPISLLFFHGIAPLAFFCNLLIVPWISMIGIPLLLIVFVLQLFFSSPLSWLWQGVDRIFYPLMKLFNLVADAEYWWSLPELSTIALLSLMIACVLWLNVKRRVWWLVITGFALPVFLQWLQPAPIALHLIDVGQGTSVVLQQNQRAILYDLGPRYGDYSATKSHVLPYLRYLGINQLDYVILSHNDSDHTGDWRVIQRAYPQATWITDIPDLPTRLGCRQLPRQWQSFKFNVLWPEPWQLAADQAPKNQHSCVVEITAQAPLKPWRILLTGDADIAAERAIVAKVPNLKTDILLLGHHGSKTSSDVQVLKQLSPLVALNSAGFDNPYRHPAPEVLAKLSLLQIPYYGTAEHGAIRVDLATDHLALQFWRQHLFLGWVENLTVHAETDALTR